MEKSLKFKPLPETVYGRHFLVWHRLRRQIPWARFTELEAYQRGGEKPKPYTPPVSYVAPIEREERTYINPERVKREIAQRIRMMEIKQSRLEMKRIRRRLAEKQKFFNVTHTID